jgi:hypothetical protein
MEDFTMTKNEGNLLNFDEKNKMFREGNFSISSIKDT